MNIRPVLVSVAAGGILLLQAGTAGAAITRTAGASYTGTAHAVPSLSEKCMAQPTDAAGFKCRFDTKVTYRTAEVHGVRQGSLHLDFTNTSKTGCEPVTGRLTTKVYRNNGRWLGTYTEDLRPGSQSCLTNVEGVEAQHLTSTIVDGKGIFADQHGSVDGHSATIRPVAQGDPIFIAGNFVATLVR